MKIINSEQEYRLVGELVVIKIVKGEGAISKIFKLLPSQELLIS